MSIAIFSSPRTTVDATTIMNAGGTGWVDKLIAALVSVGFVQTADTGQATYTSVAAAFTGVGTGLVAGQYLIFRFNDSLQSTAPLFFKIEFGDGGGGDHSPGFQITVGKGSDGAGAITNTIHQPGYQRAIGDDETLTNLYKTYVSSGDGSMLSMALFQNKGGGYQDGTAKGVFLLDRSRDGSGNPTAVGSFCHRSPNGENFDNCWTEFANYASGLSNYTYRGPVPTVYTMVQYNGFNNGINTPVWKPVGIDPSGNMWTPKAMVGYADGDLGFCQVVNLDGISGLNYLALGYESGWADMARQQGCCHAIAFY